MRVFIGYDSREEAALEVAVKSLHSVAPDIEPTILNADRLRAQGLLWRLSDHRGGQDYDLVSNEQASTRFKCTRFLTPLLAQTGFALFVDSDVVFLRDPREMMGGPNYGYAVSVVRHGLQDTGQWKMVNQTQRPHPRKWWSSVMLFDCEHPANRRLSLRDVSERSAFDLNNFYWLHDDEIGDLDPCWNVLVGVQESPPNAGLLHYTLGGMWLPGWKGGPHDDIWLAARDR